MSYLKFKVDISRIAEKFGEEFKKDVESTVNKSVQGLASMTHAKVLELATNQLTSTAKIYKEAVSFSEVEPGLWVVSLDMDKAGWIEEGRKSGFQSELLYGKSSKQGKNGRYAIIPFEHSKKPSEQSPKAKYISDEIKKELKKRDIPYRKIEVDASGSPRLGRLHSINDLSIGKPSEKSKNDALKGLTIYQTKDSTTGKIRRDVMTFRVITEKHREEGLWNHPGRKAVNIMDEALHWAEIEWSNNILPEIMRKFQE